MKKLVVFSVVFALIVGGAFAADIGATVFGKIQVAGASGDGDPESSGSMPRLRIEGSGQNGDGTYGAWIRLDNDSSAGFNGTAWWRPIPEFKMSIGHNPDGYYGKEGYATWMFYQMPSDVDIVNPHSAWGGGYVSPSWNEGHSYRNAFFGGYEGNGLMLDIKPMDMLGINIGIPFFKGGLTEDLIKSKEFIAQIDLLLDFGNIAFTYRGDASGEEPSVFVYFNLGSVDNLDLSFGLGYHVSADSDVTKPIAIGLAAKFDASEDFGLKARLLAEVAGKTGDVDAPTFVAVDLLPYYALGSDLKAFFALGVTANLGDDTDIGWHFNPYLQVGGEWGPTFYAGIRAWADWTAPDDTNWAIPIGLQVSF